MVAVAVETGPTFSAGASRVLFVNREYWVNSLHPQYVVTPDDQRFLMIRSPDEEGESRLILVWNFLEELKAKMGN